MEYTPRQQFFKLLVPETLNNGQELSMHYLMAALSMTPEVRQTAKHNFLVAAVGHYKLCNEGERGYGFDQADFDAFMEEHMIAETES